MSLLKFKSHDWESDEKWKSYLSKLEFPDGISKERHNELVTKYKRKFYSENIEKLPVECPLTSYVVEPTEKHTATIIFLHGLGDSGKGWSQIMERAYAKKFPYAKFIFPNAPKIAVTLNNGYMMPAWFDLHGLNVQSRQDEDGIIKSSQILKNLVEEQVALGISEDRIVIGGFSQGGAIATYSGLTLDRKIGGILGMSTYVPLHTRLEKDMTDFNKKTPILICHGTADMVIAYERAQLSYGFLQTLRKDNLEWKSYESMGHTSCPEEMEDVLQWLHIILK